MRSAIGAKIAVITAVATNTYKTSAICDVAVHQPARRVGEVRHRVHRHQPSGAARGIVRGSTKMLLAIVSGNSSRKLDVITLSGDFTSMPTMIHIHDSEIANTMISATASTTPSSPPAGGTR